ncbi:hypothetical protein Micbo1qcDRAFT_234156 [Microdochium bolleyi]|uniref:Uncharacterized protein n=1 Tax=Microdochium bolleyi TaxID=196109 RepID=A0A136J1I9_9PEZI|nr:hypothetical protein Micbo1qcDRAFT_234156 [Microdochium bolleyi]
MSQLFGRVRNKLSGSQSDIDPHHWRLPPVSSYTTPKPGTSNDGSGIKKQHKQTLIPDPQVFKNAFIPADPEAGLGSAGSAPATALSSSSNDDPIYPDVSHAALHLALLECFHGLRHSADALDIEVLKSHTQHHSLRHQQSQPWPQPPTYSEKPSILELVSSGSKMASVDTQPDAEAGAAASHHDLTHGGREGDDGLKQNDSESAQKWNLLVRLAVDRFEVWWRSIAKVLQHATVYTHLRHPKAAVQLSENYLPPLDVLLVWYVFMLHGDGDAYASACRDHRDVPRLQHLCFPWEALRAVIDTNAQGHAPRQPGQLPRAVTSPTSPTFHTAPAGPTSSWSGFAYNLPRAAQALFRTLSSQDADVTVYLEKPPPYVEDHSPAAFDGIDLYEEVRKLFTTNAALTSTVGFVDEAHDLLWIRSPSLVGTLTRNIRDYFDSLLSGQFDSAGLTSDPADDMSPIRFPHIPFGVNLLWRTHRLYPIQYRLFYEAKRGQLSAGQRLVPVDDTLALRSGFDGGIEEGPEEEFSTVREQISISFTPKKPMCLCWTCERIRDDAPDFAYLKTIPPTTSSWPFSPTQSAASASCPSSSSESVSSSIDGGDPTSSTSSSSTSQQLSTTMISRYDPLLMQGLSGDQLRRIQDDVAFHRAVESRRAAREPLPTRAMTAAEKDEAKRRKQNRYIPGL